MPIIRPISGLGNNFSNIAETVHNYGKPVCHTKNGIGDMVVMSISYYKKQLARIELCQKLNEARDEIRNGAITEDAAFFIKGLMPE